MRTVLNFESVEVQHLVDVLVEAGGSIDEIEAVVEPPVLVEIPYVTESGRRLIAQLRTLKEGLLGSCEIPRTFRKSAALRHRSAHAGRVFFTLAKSLQFCEILVKFR